MARQKKAPTKANKFDWDTHKIKCFLMHEQTTFIMGLLISFVVFYTFIIMISFFFTGAADQSKVINLPMSALLTNHTGTHIENWGGVRGAYFADLLINKLYGIPSFILLFFFGCVGVRLMRLRKINLYRLFFLCTSWLLWSSIFLGFVSNPLFSDTFMYLGGKYGYNTSLILIDNIGYLGSILLLLCSFILIVIFMSERTIPFLRKLFSFKWFPKTSFNFKWKKTKEEIEEDDEELESDVEESFEKEEEAAEKEEEEPFQTETFTKTTPTITKASTAKKSKEPAFTVDVAPEEETIVNSKTDSKKSFKFEVTVPQEETTSDLLQDYDPKLDLSRYKFPDVDLLKSYPINDNRGDFSEQKENQQRIQKTLENFGIHISSIKATVGPTITLYEVIPEEGVRISKIRNLGDDIALSLSALGIRIIAPMPGKGTVGIEVPNKDPQIVSMKSVIVSKKFQECNYDLPVVMGKTITNETFMFDLCKMPHLLVAGATGQGKSVGLNALITSLLYKKHPSELKFVMVDPKMVEFSIYSIIERHYLAKLPDTDKAIITDFKKVTQTLNSLCQEMDNRYNLLMKAHARNIKEYNKKFISRKLNPNKGHRFMPFIVVIIDEFGDLIMTAGKEIEMPIARIAQKARAVGIHMVIATQRPTTTIITGTIKANFPARMAFRVSSMIDSRTILDAPGANQLIGRGDMLFSQGSEMIRVQCAFVDTPEVEKITDFIGKQAGYPTAFMLPEYIQNEDSTKDSNGANLNERDSLFEEAARMVILQQQGSTSMLQRKFSIGYNRAGRLMDQLEAAGIVGGFEGSKPRQVLMMDEYSLEQLLNELK